MRSAPLGILVTVVAASGCRISASAQGSVNSSADAEASASAKVEQRAAPEPAPEMATGKSITLNQGKLEYEGVISFEYDKANLQDDAETQRTLAEFKAFLEQHPDLAIEVEGHTDSRGSDEYNRDLSERRAASVRAWLVDNGIGEGRITSVGKGEDEPQVPEPAECDDRLPSDQSVCEGPWATNRRVVFRVTQGEETVELAQAEPQPLPPEPPADPEPEPPAPGCPWLYGGHANLLGPNSWVTLAGAVQPGICWLELSLGVGVGFGEFDASEPAGGFADGDYVSFTVPLRGRIWFMNRHSLIGDVGIGITHYRLSADMTDAVGASGDYTRNTTPLIAHLGVGYGFRPNASEAGPRFAFVLGPLFHLTDLGGSEFTPGGLAAGAALQQSLDNDTDDLADLELYGEASFGWLF